MNSNIYYKEFKNCTSTGTRRVFEKLTDSGPRVDVAVHVDDRDHVEVCFIQEGCHLRVTAIP